MLISAVTTCGSTVFPLNFAHLLPYSQFILDVPTPSLSDMLLVFMYSR